MNQSRWDRLEELFGKAGGLPEAERDVFVEREASDDPELRADLLALLEASDGAVDYLNQLRQDLLGSDVQGILRDVPTAAATSDPWIGRTVSHYQIGERIGAGGMGVVYHARDLTLDRPVALKFIAPEISRDPEAKQRFLHEARTASALDHPNICTIHEIAEAEDGRLFIAMAAYEGETLRTRLGRGPLSEDDALDISEQIARALAAAHERGIVHRDVKPANVFITREGVVKLLDFGLARTGDATLSETGVVKGTVGYMSPEQARGERADERSDIWAVGVMMFEMLAGERPFAADSPEAAIHLILTFEPDLRATRPDAGAKTTEVVHKALSKDPASRFAKGSALLQALSESKPVLPSSAVTRRVPAQRRLLVGAAVVGVLTIVIVVAQQVGGGSDTAGIGVVQPSVSRILWVDDNPENNASVVLRLRELGVHVATVPSTTDALERYDPDVFQLIISDMGRYEGENDEYVDQAGFELFEQLKAMHEGVQLVFCTSPRGVKTHREEALAAGAIDIFTNCDDVMPLIGF